MYTTQPGVVVALDARTGRQIWRYRRASRRSENPHEINPFNRGVAVLGHRRVRRHARRRAGRARRANGLAAVGNADRRHDARLQPDEPAAGGQRQGHRRHRRRRVRRARIPRRLRRGDRQAPVAMVCGARTRRIRQRHMEGRQLEARRQPDVAAPAPTIPS